MYVVLVVGGRKVEEGEGANNDDRRESLICMNAVLASAV